MMNIKNKLTARLNRLKAANSGQKGLGIGAIILIVILLGAIAYAANKFGGDTPSGDKQKVKLDAGALASQTVQLRTGISLLTSEVPGNWIGAANKSGKLSLASGSIDYTNSATVPIGPLGTDSAAIKWSFGSITPAGATTPTVYSWTGATVPSAVCIAFNAGVNGGAGTPAAHALTGIGTAVAQTLAAGNTDAVTVDASLSTALETALAGKTSACVDSGGSYRIVTKLN